MSGKTERDNHPVDLIKSRKDLKNKAQQAAEQGEGGKKQSGFDGPALFKYCNRRKQNKRHGEGGHLEDVLVPIN